jgi:ABC-type transporter Mla subunit MlaD
VRLANGSVGAQLTLKLNKSKGEIPLNSRVTILSKSVLGLKFVSIDKGSSHRFFADGGTVPISQTNVPVQLDQVFSTFDPKTRRATQQALVGSGDTLAGRGGDLNDTISHLPDLLGHLEPVARYLADPTSELTRFFDSLNGLMTTVEPVSPTFARSFGEMATTFDAISRDPQALEQTIARSPSTLDVSTRSLQVQQPFLTDFASLGRSLTPATASLHRALPAINPAIEQGARVLGRTPALNRRLQGVMVSLKNLAQAPGTDLAINALTATVSTLNPMIRYLGPYITVCNDWNYWWTNLAGDLDEATTFGYAQRALLNQTNPLQPNNVGSAGATAPVNGGVPDTPLGGNEFLHGPAYGAAIDSNGFADCETGQRGYPKKLNANDPQGRNLQSDQHTPGDQGPTFTGRARVPAGETFSRNPQTGPQTLFNPANP